MNKNLDELETGNNTRSISVEEKKTFDLKFK